MLIVLNALYFIGPFVLAWVIGRRLLNVGWRPYVVGIVAFVVASDGTAIVVVLGKGAGVLLGASELSLAWIGAAATGIGAGLCEEGCRARAFAWLRRRGTAINWKTGVMYAIGHSGLEVIIVGAMLVGLLVLLRAAPEALTGSLAEYAAAMGKTSIAATAVGVAQRLLGGTLIHTCFTMLVVRSFRQGRRTWFWGAVAWHAVHDFLLLIPGTQRWMAASYGRLGLVLGTGMALYAAILWRLVRTERAAERVASA